MITLLLGIIIFLQIIEYIVLIDVILSWLTLFSIRFRPRFIADILDPLYKIVQKFIPTRIGPFDLTPILVIVFLAFLRLSLLMLFPELSMEVNTPLNP